MHCKLGGKKLAVLPVIRNLGFCQVRIFCNLWNGMSGGNSFKMKFKVHSNWIRFLFAD